MNITPYGEKENSIFEAVTDDMLINLMVKYLYRK